LRAETAHLADDRDLGDLSRDESHCHRRGRLGGDVRRDRLVIGLAAG
jgi:hypothetical protein